MLMSGRKIPSLTNQTVFLTAAKTVGFFISLILPMLLARKLSPREYGSFKQAFLIVGTLAGVLPFGVGMSAFYYLARESHQHRSAVINILVFHALMGGFAFAALLLYPRVLLTIFPDGSALVANAHWIGLLIFITITSTLLETVATAYQDVHYSTMFLIGAQISKAVFMLSAVIINPSLQNLLRAALLQAFLEGAVLLWYLNLRFPRYWTAFDPAFFYRQLHYALPIGFASLLYIGQTELPSYFVSWSFGAAAFAVYANGNFQVPLLGILRESISSVLLARTSGLQHDGMIEEIRQLNFRVTRKLMLVYFPAFALLEVCGRDLLILFYGPQYSGSWPIFRINLILLPFNIFVNDPVLRAFAEHRYVLVILRCVNVVLMVPGIWFLSKTFGLTGTMAAVVGFSILERSVLVYWVSRILGSPGAEFVALWRAGLRIGACAAVAAGFAFVTRAVFVGHKPLISLVVVGSIFALADVAAIFFSGALIPEEIGLLRHYTARLFGSRLKEF
jgi:O-antigen/teichoic acid export membrane protein